MPGRTPGVALVALIAALGAATSAQAATTTQSERITLSDGISVHTEVKGEAPLAARPAIVEFSPYGRGSRTFEGGAEYNNLLVQIRGTGDSDGRFDALGPRTQADVVEVLTWACAQPWSDGRLGLNGFSASAITIYNSLHQALPCVETAVLKSGTHELYRDLIYPGGISNLVPSFGVLALIGAPALAQSFDRLARDPLSGFTVAQGLTGTGLEGFAHSTLDEFWRERGFRGDANDLPILMVDGFFDVESRGAFQGYQGLRDDGAHLVVLAGHETVPAGTDGGSGKMKAWFDRYLRGIPNGVEDTPRVQLWMADGDREELGQGKFVRRDAADWPVPGTRWETLELDAKTSGTATSINDGSLGLEPPARGVKHSYPAHASLPTASDPPNAAIAGAGGADILSASVPALGDMDAAEPLGLSYTTEPLRQDVLAAGPASLEVLLSSTAPQTGIWAVISDVSPEGTPHPVAAGRLNSDFPGVDHARSLKDAGGGIVQPYGTYDNRQPAPVGQERRYQVELWPIGNRFKAGHRIRLHVVSQSAASMPGAPAVNTVSAGGPDGSLLRFPVLPESDLYAALGAARSGPGGPARPCANKLAGSAGSDRLRGSGASDRIEGLGGADLLTGLGSGDCILGGRGYDLLRGGPGDDSLGAGPGRDWVRAGAGDDRVRAAGMTRDRVNCGPGADVATVDERDRVRNCETVRLRRRVGTEPRPRR